MKMNYNEWQKDQELGRKVERELAEKKQKHVDLQRRITPIIKKFSKISQKDTTAKMKTEFINKLMNIHKEIYGEKNK